MKTMKLVATGILAMTALSGIASGQQQQIVFFRPAGSTSFIPVQVAAVRGWTGTS